MKKLNQSGFSGVYMVIIIAAIALVGFVGWKVYDSNQAKPTDSVNTEQEESSTEETEEVEAEVDETANWLLYESPGKEFKLRLADGWKLTRYEKSPSVYTFNNDNLSLVSGTKATVTETDLGRDGGTGLGISYVDVANLSDKRGTKQASLKTISGLEIEKYIFTQTVEPDGIDIPKGATQYTYYIVKGDKAIFGSYSVVAGQTDYHELVEKVIKTIEF